MEISNIETLIKSKLSENTKAWYIGGFVELDKVNEIIKSVDLNLSDKSKVEILAKNKTHPLNGKRSTFITFDYGFKLNDEYTFKDKFDFSIDMLIMNSKFRKLF